MEKLHALLFHERKDLMSKTESKGQLDFPTYIQNLNARIHALQHKIVALEQTLMKIKMGRVSFLLLPLLEVLAAVL